MAMCKNLYKYVCLCGANCMCAGIVLLRGVCVCVRVRALTGRVHWSLVYSGPLQVVPLSGIPVCSSSPDCLVFTFLTVFQEVCGRVYGAILMSVVHNVHSIHRFRIVGPDISDVFVKMSS
jgi:hypothetical protein